MEQPLDVKVPGEWMRGWVSRFVKENELPEDDLVHYTNYSILNHFLDVIGKDTDSLNILELGCGTGKAACFLASLGHKVEAIDAIPVAIELGERRAELLDVTQLTKFHLADMQMWRIDPQSYDVIVSLQSLQYLLDATMTKLDEILKGIKDSGYFIYSGNINPHFPTEPPIRFITRKEMEDKLQEWTIHRISEEEWLLRPGDRRGFLQVLAQKIPETERTDIT